MLTLQGVGWFTRKAIQLATVTLDINQYRDDNGVEHIDIEQTATGGIKGTTENRTLDWTYVFFFSSSYFREGRGGLMMGVAAAASASTRTICSGSSWPSRGG